MKLKNFSNYDVIWNAHAVFHFWAKKFIYVPKIYSCPRKCLCRQKCNFKKYGDIGPSSIILRKVASGEIDLKIVLRVMPQKFSFNIFDVLRAFTTSFVTLKGVVGAKCWKYASNSKWLLFITSYRYNSHDTFFEIISNIFCLPTLCGSIEHKSVGKLLTVKKI